MLKHLVIFLLSILLLGFSLAACGGEVAALPTVTPKPTETSTSIPTSTLTVTATHTPTPTYPPYLPPTLEPRTVLIALSTASGDGAGEIYDCLTASYPYPSFMLFDDGLLVRTRGYMAETYLTGAEIEELFADIESTGLFGIEFKNGRPWESGVYDMPEGLEYGEGGWGTTLIVKDVNISTIPSLSEYLVQPVVDTISIIREFEPLGEWEPFQPERLFFFMFDVNADFSELAHYSRSVSGEWPADLFPLEERFLYWLDEEQTKSFMEFDLFSSYPDVKVFSQDDAEYFVIACPDLYPWWNYYR